MVAPVCCLENSKGSLIASHQLLSSNSVGRAWRVSCVPAEPSSRHSTGLSGNFLNLPALWYFPICEFFSRSFSYYIPKALVVGEKHSFSSPSLCLFSWLVGLLSLFLLPCTHTPRKGHTSPDQILPPSQTALIPELLCGSVYLPPYLGKGSYFSLSWVVRKLDLL